jgi:hypothetical protein
MDRWTEVPQLACVAIGDRRSITSDLQDRRLSVPPEASGEETLKY